MPWGYGVAWRKYDLRATILAPIPLNFVFAWVRERYYQLLQGPRRTLEQSIIEHLSEEEAKGYNDGYRTGLKSGEEAGFRRAKIIEDFIKDNYAQPHP